MKNEMRLVTLAATDTQTNVQTESKKVVTVNETFENAYVRITKNYIMVKIGIKTVYQVSSEFYNVYENENGFIVAEDLEDANTIINPIMIIEVENLEASENVISRTNITGEVKKRLTKQEKQEYLTHYEENIKYDLAFLQCKTIKAKAIHLIENEFPISVVALCLEKRFQQIRQYAVQYYGKNLKQL